MRETNDILIHLKEAIQLEWSAPSGCTHFYLRINDGGRETTCPIVVAVGRFDDGEEMLRLNTYAIPLDRAIYEIERLRARVAELEDIIAGKRPLIDGGES